MLLRKLEGDMSLQGFTHVIIDEVHERTEERYLGPLFSVLQCKHGIYNSNEREGRSSKMECILCMWKELGSISREGRGKFQKPGVLLLVSVDSTEKDQWSDSVQGSFPVLL